MELRHLRYFTAVYAQGSISRAAELLLISQPALTRQIRELEREIGAPLFDRVPSGVRPTPAGAALNSHALQVLRLADATREVARSAAPAREWVEIGLPPGLPQDWLRDALHKVQHHVPNVAVTFIDASSAEQLRLVSEGRIDIAIVHQHPPNTLHQRLLFEQPFGVAFKPNRHTNGTATLPMRELDGLKVLIHAREQIPDEHDRMISVANDLGISPNWRFARFSENALLCAEAAEADAVLLSEPSAARMLPNWPWSQLIDPAVPLRTWMARQDRTRTIVTAAMEAISLHRNPAV
jgi:LysR family transcriptional regulator, benzoate and cis,cis-muconate-responsive activator of ben and cat genes